MSLLSALIAGGAFGVRHAVEADHLAAVATIDRDGRGRPGHVGAWWGVGHGLPIALAGSAVLFLGVEVPRTVTGTFETIAGSLLVLLGLAVLLDHLGLGVHRHDHDGSTHRHVALGQQYLGTGHQHVDLAALAVGVVHGLAGSGALVVGLVATASSLHSGAAFLGGFLGASLLTMAGLSVVWRRVGSTGVARPLRLGAGLLAIGIGLGMVLPAMT